MARPEHRSRGRLITREREIAEIESWSNGAAHQGMRPGGAGRLPPTAGNSPCRTLGAIERAEPVLADLDTVRRCHPEVEWGALIEVPDLVRLHPMPAAHRRARQEKVDGREGCAGPTPITRMHDGARPIQLAVVPAFRMGNQSEGRDEVLGPVDHAVSCPCKTASHPRDTSALLEVLRALPKHVPLGYGERKVPVRAELQIGHLYQSVKEAVLTLPLQSEVEPLHGTAAAGELDSFALVVVSIPRSLPVLPGSEEATLTISFGRSKGARQG